MADFGGGDPEAFRKEVREWVEAGLKSGVLKAVVASRRCLQRLHAIHLQPAAAPPPLALPANLVPTGVDGKRFADAYFVLEPGSYHVRAVPMKNATEPLSRCAPAESLLAP
jgi:hypothetical protein